MARKTKGSESADISNDIAPDAAALPGGEPQGTGTAVAAETLAEPSAPPPPDPAPEDPSVARRAELEAESAAALEAMEKARAAHRENYARVQQAKKELDADLVRTDRALSAAAAVYNGIQDELQRLPAGAKR